MLEDSNPRPPDSNPETETLNIGDNMKRRVLIPTEPDLPDEPPMSMVPLAVDTHDDYECDRHGKVRDKVVQLVYAFADGKGTPYRPDSVLQCIDCFNQTLRQSARRARTRHAMWEDGWEIPCDICRKADRDLKVSQRTLFVRDENDTESLGWDSHPTYLICEECATHDDLRLASLHALYMKELDD